MRKYFNRYKYKSYAWPQNGEERPTKARMSVQSVWDLGGEASALKVNPTLGWDPDRILCVSACQGLSSVVCSIPDPRTYSDIVKVYATYCRGQSGEEKTRWRAHRWTFQTSTFWLNIGIFLTSGSSMGHHSVVQQFLLHCPMWENKSLPVVAASTRNASEMCLVLRSHVNFHAMQWYLALAKMMI